MGQIQSPRITKSFTIASATSISSGIDLEGYRIAALDMSSGWDAANRMTFRVSNNGSTFYDLYDEFGVEVQIASGSPLTSATGRSIVPVDSLAISLLAHRYIRIQSGPSSAPVNLSTGVTIDVILLPV